MPRNPEFTRHRVFEADAPQAAKVLFEGVCDRLTFSMDRALCKDDERPMLQARGSQTDQDLIRRLKIKLGVTKNALMLTVIRLGLAQLRRAVAEESK